MLDVDIRSDFQNQQLRRAVERVAEHRVRLLPRHRSAYQHDAANVVVEGAEDREVVTSGDRGDSIFRRAENELLSGALDCEERQHRPTGTNDER